MSVLLGNGNGTFQPSQSYDGAYSPDLRNESGITTGDVDNDGDVDIMVGNAASNDVSIYLNKGNGHFIFKGRVGMYWGVASPIYADFTGDGKNDIIATVGIPPSGIESQLALIKGTVFNSSSVTDNRTQYNTVTKANAQPGNEIMVLNNPFINYIDVKFEKIQTGKITLQLSDLTGTPLAAEQFAVTSQTAIRFNLQNKVLKTGIYILTAEAGKKLYRVRVMKQ